ncbi:MAG TPA: hypothetical protein VKB76_06140 [Ktedonobacterales bacterium]|nr:hypothetical protein [Ktedonobacterales bacterium]
MQLPTHDALVRRLIFEFGYPTSYVAKFADELLQLEPQLQEAFSIWWYTGAIPSFAVEGFTIQRLVDEYRSTIPNAFTTLDWLIREPEVALYSLTHPRCGGVA